MTQFKTGLQNHLYMELGEGNELVGFKWESLCQQVDASLSVGQRQTYQAEGEIVLLSSFAVVLLGRAQDENPDSLVNFDEFSRKFSGRCKTTPQRKS